MIIVMKKGSSAKQVSAVVARVEAAGYRVHLSEGEERTIIGVIGDDRPIDRTHFEMLDGVEKTVPILKPFKMASRDMHPQDSQVALDGVKIGGSQIVIMAGPCSVETREQIIETAIAVKEAGAHALDDAEVADLDRHVARRLLVEKQVCGLDVAVHEAAIVCRLQA